MWVLLDRRKGGSPFISYWLHKFKVTDTQEGQPVDWKNNLTAFQGCIRSTANLLAYYSKGLARMTCSRLIGSDTASTAIQRVLLAQLPLSIGIPTIYATYSDLSDWLSFTPLLIICFDSFHTSNIIQISEKTRCQVPDYAQISLVHAILDSLRPRQTIPCFSTPLKDLPRKSGCKSGLKHCHHPGFLNLNTAFEFKKPTLGLWRARTSPLLFLVLIESREPSSFSHTGRSTSF